MVITVGSFTGVMVISNVALSTAPLSESATVKLKLSRVVSSPA